MKKTKSTPARLLRQKRYREQHREKTLAYARQYRQKNQRKLNAYFQKWRDSNQEKYVAYQRKYRVRKSERRDELLLSGTGTGAEWNRLVEILLKFIHGTQVCKIHL